MLMFWRAFKDIKFLYELFSFATFGSKFHPMLLFFSSMVLNFGVR